MVGPAPYLVHYGKSVTPDPSHDEDQMLSKVSEVQCVVYPGYRGVFVLDGKASRKLFILLHPN